MVEERLFDPEISAFDSTRDSNSIFDFPTVALTGLAPDGGLFLPRKLPKLTLERLVKLNFQSRMELLLQDLLPKEYFSIHLISDIVYKAYKHFPESGTPIVNLGQDLATAELFHGPSASFKGLNPEYIYFRFIIFSRLCSSTFSAYFAGMSNGGRCSGYNDFSCNKWRHWWCLTIRNRFSFENFCF